MRHYEWMQLTVGALLLAGLIAVGPFGCATKNGPVVPPNPELTAAVVHDATAITCSLAVPQTDRNEARVYLEQLRDLAARDPAAAYELAQSPRMVVIPAVGLLWNSIHLYLDTTVTDAAQWTALAQQMIGAAASGCLAGLGPVVPEVAIDVYPRRVIDCGGTELVLDPCRRGYRSVHGNCWREGA